MSFGIFRKQRECYRIASGSYTNDKRYIPGTRTPLNIKASLQPSTPTDLLVLPEGLRDRETYTLRYETTDPLRTVKTSTSQMPDIVVHDGDDYDCVYTKKWRNDIINHYMSLIQKSKNNPGGGA